MDLHELHSKPAAPMWFIEGENGGDRVGCYGLVLKEISGIQILRIYNLF